MPAKASRIIHHLMLSSDDNTGSEVKVSREKTIDPGLEALLDLNGEVFPMDNGFWTKFEAWKVVPSEQIPHGVRYSLTLHDKYNKRIIGYDNAHAIKPKRSNFAAKKKTWDHKHKMEKVEDYEFESAGKLMEDFWVDVEAIQNV
ncbi:MAG: hypothetical protein XD36_3033 [Halomonas sp. 54_146]|nr:MULTISPECIES: DUF6516 family protein [unclassified Halomonas]KUJ86536.1 MAG: hypothetical protein XD36_3033 [Halomonas sp. 54_146]